MCFVQEWSENNSRRLALLSSNVLVTFLIHVPSCRIPEGISLSLFYWYLWCDAVWVWGLWQLTLCGSTWTVCCCEQSNNVFVTCCQMPYTPLFILFFVLHFLYNKAKTCPTFPWQVGNAWGFEERKSMAKLQAQNQTNKCHVRLETNIKNEILYELCRGKTLHCAELLVYIFND